MIVFKINFNTNFSFLYDNYKTILFIINIFYKKCINFLKLFYIYLNIVSEVVGILLYKIKLHIKEWERIYHSCSYYEVKLSRFCMKLNMGN